MSSSRIGPPIGLSGRRHAIASNLSVTLVAMRRASWSRPAARMLAVKPPVCCTAARALEVLSMHASARGGSRETAQKALTVRPRGSESLPKAVRTTTSPGRSSHGVSSERVEPLLFGFAQHDSQVDDLVAEPRRHLEVLVLHRAVQGVVGNTEPRAEVVNERRGIRELFVQRVHVHAPCLHQPRNVGSAQQLQKRGRVAGMEDGVAAWWCWAN